MRRLTLGLATPALLIALATTSSPAAAQSPAPAPGTAQLSVAVSGVPQTVKRNRWVTAKVRVSNTGTKKASGVTIKALRPKGVSTSPSSVKLKDIKSGKSRTAKLRLRITRKGVDDVTVRIRVKAKGNVTAAATATLLTKAGFAARGPFVGRSFWGFELQVDRAWDNYGLYFSSPKWAYWGFADGGLRNCTAAAPVLDDQGAPTGDGCFPVTYDAKTGAVSVGEHTGTYSADGVLTVDGITFSELQVPEAGTRFATALHHRGFRGLCGLSFGCTTWHYRLALTADGGFVRSDSSISSFGDGYTTPGIWASNYPPDEYGTYNVEAGGRILFSYADGTVKAEQLGVERNSAGQPDPVGSGLVIGDTNFYPDTE